VSGRPQHDGRRGEEYVRKTARDYAEKFPWVDLKASEISNAINACYNGQRAALGRMFETLGAGSTLGRSTLLRALYFADGRPLTHNEIGAELQITPGSVTYLVDGLEKAGLVKRTIHPSDRRTINVELTPQGLKVAAELTPAVARFTNEMCAGFSEEEKLLFLDLLFRFLRNATASNVSAGTTAHVVDVSSVP
jgi:MarR family transcriptional regulator, 2-MHQ and catechol-resistance regulon repressor